MASDREVGEYLSEENSDPYSLQQQFAPGGNRESFAPYYNFNCFHLDGELACVAWLGTTDSKT